MGFALYFGSLALFGMLQISIKVVGASQCSDAADVHSMTAFSMCSTNALMGNGIVVDMSPMTSSSETYCKCNAYVHGAASGYTVSFFDFRQIRPYDNCGSSVDVEIEDRHEFTFNCQTIGSISVRNGQQFSLILNKEGTGGSVNADYCILVLSDVGSSNISISCEGDTTSTFSTKGSSPTSQVMGSSSTGSDDSTGQYSTIEATYNTNGQSDAGTSVLATFFPSSPTDLVTMTKMATENSTDDHTKLITISATGSTGTSGTDIVPTKAGSSIASTRTSPLTGYTGGSIEGSVDSTVDIYTTALRHTSFSAESTQDDNTITVTKNVDGSASTQDKTPLLMTSTDTVAVSTSDTESPMLSTSDVSQASNIVQSSISSTVTASPTTSGPTNLSTRIQGDDSDDDDEIIMIFIPIVAVVIVLLIIIAIAVCVTKRRREEEQRLRLIQKLKSADPQESYSNWILQEPSGSIGIVNNTYSDVSEVTEIVPPFDSSLELTNVADTNPQDQNSPDDDGIQTKWTIVNNNDMSDSREKPQESPEQLYSTVQKPKPGTDNRESEYIATPPHSLSSNSLTTDTLSLTMNMNDDNGITDETESPRHKSIIKVRKS